mmetsp:Transcript_2045/g.4679  ORF Transcript_2045/g.4679 Transcript_2045/m.4679 type:complete len:378 (+) Transcript_2045:318-1451(+)
MPPAAIQAASRRPAQLSPGHVRLERVPRRAEVEEVRHERADAADDAPGEDIGGPVVSVVDPRRADEAREHRRERDQRHLEGGLVRAPEAAFFRLRRRVSGLQELRRHPARAARAVAERLELPPHVQGQVEQGGERDPCVPGGERAEMLVAPAPARVGLHVVAAHRHRVRPRVRAVRLEELGDGRLDARAGEDPRHERLHVASDPVHRRGDEDRPRRDDDRDRPHQPGGDGLGHQRLAVHRVGQLDGVVALFPRQRQGEGGRRGRGGRGQPPDQHGAQEDRRGRRHPPARAHGADLPVEGVSIVGRAVEERRPQHPPVLRRTARSAALSLFPGALCAHLARSQPPASPSSGCGRWQPPSPSVFSAEGRGGGGGGGGEH